MNSYEVINNEKQLQFEVHSQGELGSLVYRFFKHDIVMMHTEVPDALSGKGIASTLAHFGFEWAKAQNKKVIVYCPFVAAYLTKHPEYNELIDKTSR